MNTIFSSRNYLPFSLLYLQRLRDAGGVVDPERGVQFPDIREMRVAGSKDVVAFSIVISYRLVDKNTYVYIDTF